MSIHLFMYNLFFSYLVIFRLFVDALTCYLFVFLLYTLCDILFYCVSMAHWRLQPSLARESQWMTKVSDKEAETGVLQGFAFFFTILTAFPVWTQITIKFVLVREDPYIYVFIKQSNLWQSGFVKAVEFQGWSCSLTISWSHHYCIYIHCIVAELPDQQTSTVSKSKHMLSCKVAVRQQCSEMFSSSWWTNSNSTNCGCNTVTNLSPNWIYTVSLWHSLAIC